MIMLYLELTPDATPPANPNCAVKHTAAKKLGNTYRVPTCCSSSTCLLAWDQQVLVQQVEEIYQNKSFKKWGFGFKMFVTVDNFHSKSAHKGVN